MFLTSILQIISQLFWRENILVKIFSVCISTGFTFFPKRFWVVVVKYLHFPGCSYQDREGHTQSLLTILTPLDVKVFTRVRGFFLHHILICQTL